MSTSNLREKRANIWEQMKALSDRATAENRDLSAEETVSYNKMEADLDALTKRLIEVVRDIEAIDAAHEQDGDDDAEVEDGEFDASAV